MKDMNTGTIIMFGSSPPKSKGSCFALFFPRFAVLGAINFRYKGASCVTALYTRISEGARNKIVEVIFTMKKRGGLFDCGGRTRRDPVHMIDHSLGGFSVGWLHCLGK
jgi:hypothetical protein